MQPEPIVHIIFNNMNRLEKSQKPSKRHQKMGDLLVEAGLIDKKTLIKALDLQKAQKKKIGQILIDMGIADDEEIAKALAKQLEIPFSRLDKVNIPKETISLVPSELAERHLLIPIKKTEKGLLIAMANPLDLYAVDDLRFVTHMPIKVTVSPQRDILEAIEKNYPKQYLEKDLNSAPGIDESIEILQQVDADNTEAKELLELTDRPPIVRLTNAILADAIKLNASDVHIEPQKDSVIVRYRVDGIMREIMRMDKHLQASVISRIKVISNLDISLRRKPQDGKAQIKYGGRTYDLRVSTLPTSYGETVTMRILNPAAAQLTPENLGFSEKNLKDVNNIISMPEGIILVTGPTGSGKTSTLYTCLNRLNSPTVNIITVEDPVEFDIKGINQVPINPKAGITFAEGLRSILRQDPDIVMVGEIRDNETASIAFRAAQTGHLVFSTLHTNNAPSAVTRLLDLGIKDFLISSSLIAVIGQRLVRRVCKKCKIPDSLNPQLLKQIIPFIGKDSRPAFWKGAGCEACSYTGYSGRLGLFEILLLTSSLKEVIAPGVSAFTIKQAAQKEGFQSLSTDGIQKASQGLTTIEEVFRVAPPEADDTSQMPFVDAPFPDKFTAEEPVLKGLPALVSSPSPKKILVADDNEVILRVLRHLFESENYLVITAESGLEALKLSLQEKPDLIITDYLMPEMDGLTLIKKLKSQLTSRYIPIIMLTVKDNIDLEVKGIDAGADDYITKPFNPKSLLVRVQRLINRPLTREM